MKSDNELIAEFMGWRIEGEPEFKAPYEIWISETGARMYPRTDPQGNKYPEKFKFHESWDWLMPVVEKINGMGKMVNINFYTDPMCIETVIYNWGLGDPQQRSGVECNSPIESVYKAVVEFIKWYKSVQQ